MVPSTTARPSAATNRTATLDPRFGLALTEGEQVLVDGRPDRRRLLAYLTFGTVLLCALSVFGLLALPFVLLANRAFVDKHRYWVTSSRIIVTTGIIGFRARSIPLERVSDVAISCNWLERLFGLRTVVVRDMTGEAMSGARMLAIGDASGMQRQILDRVHEVNRRAPSPEGDRMLANSYREIEHRRGHDDLLELLRRIEANTRPATH